MEFPYLFAPNELDEVPKHPPSFPNRDSHGEADWEPFVPW